MRSNSTPNPTAQVSTTCRLRKCRSIRRPEARNPSERTKRRSLGSFMGQRGCAGEPQPREREQCETPTDEVGKHARDEAAAYDLDPDSHRLFCACDSRELITLN